MQTALYNGDTVTVTHALFSHWSAFVGKQVVNVLQQCETSFCNNTMNQVALLT